MVGSEVGTNDLLLTFAIFPEKYTVKDIISNTKLEKDDHYYIQTTTAQGSFFPLQSYSKKTLREKCPEKSSKIKTKSAHAHWASYNTP